MFTYTQYNLIAYHHHKRACCGANKMLPILNFCYTEQQIIIKLYFIIIITDGVIIKYGQLYKGSHDINTVIVSHYSMIRKYHHYHLVFQLLIGLPQMSILFSNQEHLFGIFYHIAHKKYGPYLG